MKPTVHHGLLLLLLLASGAMAVESGPARIVIVVAEESAHFNAAVAGLRAHFSTTLPATTVNIHYLSRAPLRLDFTPELTVTLGSASLDALPADRNRGLPLVACMVLDPPPPAASIAGAVILDHAPETQARAIRQVLPQARTLGIIHRQCDRERVQSQSEAARQEGFAVLTETVENPTHLPGALDRLMDRIDVLWIPPDPALYNAQTAKGLLLFSFRQRIPLISPSEPWVRAGTLLAEQNETWRERRSLDMQESHDWAAACAAAREGNNVVALSG